MQKLIHLVWDYAPGDLACAEVVSALAAQIPADYHWHITSVNSFDTVAAGSFNVHEGDIAFSPGSSGHDRKFWEIFQRGGSAWHTYRKPRPGSVITIKA